MFPNIVTLRRLARTPDSNNLVRSFEAFCAWRGEPWCAGEENRVRLEKNDAFGVICDESNNVRGLWLADQASTRNTIRLRVILAMQEAQGRKVDLSDYAAVISGTCSVDPGPVDIGGYLILFPSARLKGGVEQG